MRTPTVVLDVEGVAFKTSLSTLTSVPSCTLAKLVAGGDWKKQLDQQGHLFIDRDSRVFPVILGFLRDGHCTPLPHDEWFLARIAHEARYFNLPELEKMAIKRRQGIMEGRRDTIHSHSHIYTRPSTEKVEIPRKRSEAEKGKRRSILSHLSISLPRNFAHLAHVGWRGTDLVLATSDPSKKEEPSMRAIAKAAKDSPASQVYNVVEGDSGRYGSQGVEIVLCGTEMRPIPRSPLPPFRPALPPIAEP